MLRTLDDKEVEKQFGDMKPGSQEHVRRIHTARKAALEHIIAARAAYKKRLEEDYQNIMKGDRVFVQGQIVRLTIYRDDSQKKAKKLKTMMTEKHIINSSSRA